ncbi:unnamed protein product [Arabis nemorensis]|uniref:mitogen-activated protein kinase kinase n=1 Tax=Arabis nemorensis TaxID=586526 RepID=A0A565BG82_9BRAS|nr:unnamed protein product [Arabis nemorensis]
MEIYELTRMVSPIKPVDDEWSLSDLDKVKVIGEGSNGVIQLVQHKFTGQFFALKVIKLSIDRAIRKSIAQELKINQSSQCPYLVTWYKSFYDDVGAISVISDYMDGGSLADFLKSVKTIPESYLSAIFKQVLQGLIYLHHDKHIIHRDLKPSHLLINHRGEVKITGFGVSKVMTNTAGLANTFVGTCNYMSPERIVAVGNKYGTKSDIWSLGLVVLECATGKFPYAPLGQDETWTSVFDLMEAIVDQPPPALPSGDFSPELSSFISSCLQKDPKRRSSAKELMEHPFLSKYNDLEISLASYFTNAGSSLISGSVDIFNSKKVASLANAPIQGKTPLVAHFQNLSLMDEDGQSPPIIVDEMASYPTTKEKTGEAECILVFSCNDNLDVEETSFIESILKELHAREVTPLTYSLSGRENMDEDMLGKSSVGILVLSDSSFARSSQSLDHLVAIMEHGKATNHEIIPIYFKVTHADLCGFEAAFLQYQNSVQADRVQKWKTTMTEIASINGHEWTKGTQFMVTEEVVRDACLRLYLKNSKNVARVLAFLNHSQSPSEAEIVGLWGMAGIGKTCIAREIFGRLAPQYDLTYFIQDFDLLCKEKGVRQMRDDFFSKIFREEKPSISACDIKPSFMRDWFHSKTILVVLDDVNCSRDVEAVVGGFGWFSHGHRIILTSRRKQVLVKCKVKEPYEIQKLCEFESFRLCKQYLNGEIWFISKLMSCTSGIPLAINVFGSSVSKQNINNMKFHLISLRRDPPPRIQESFRRSFDGLDENEKNIFLDLACFFRGENMDHVVQLLDACGFFTYLGICDLIDESLISLMDNRIEIPVPFQDIGRFIVCEEDENPCERSRLWDSNDIVDVLTNNSGTEAIEGIFLDASDLTFELSPTVFSNMYRLRLLKFHSGNECKLSLPHGLDTLPEELRLLHWENYPLKYLPHKFNPENLVEVNMPYSNMEKLWEGKKNLEKLKKIKLSHSRKLTDILMLSEALNLEDIDLEGCTSLVDVSTSIPRCGKLVSLNMKDCSRLGCLPAMVDLTSLKLLNLSGCSELHEIQDFAPNLKELYLAGTAIKELPLSIENLTKLGTLDLENCRRLKKLPLGIKNSCSILELKLSGCTTLER